MASARGKVIFFGEHAVVYGHPALAGAISRQVAITVAESTEGEGVRLDIPCWEVRAAAGDGSAVGGALAAMTAAAGITAPVHLLGEADLPAAVGLGSSAALSVAVARALLPDAGGAAIEDVAMAGERAFHDNPSGIDVVMAARGGLGLFRRGAGLAAVDAPPVRLCIALSGESRQTAKMVAAVRARREAMPQKIDGELLTLGELAAAGAKACARGDVAAVGEMMDRAHAGLCAIGVSTDTLDALVTLARDAGALGAKLTGGGGGGAVIALAPGREDAVLGAWREAGFSAFACEAG